MLNLEKFILDYGNFQLNIKKISASNVKNQRYELLKFNFFYQQNQLEIRELSDLKDLILKYIKKRSVFKSRRTIYRIIMIIKHFFRYLEAKGVIDESPIEWLQGPKINSNERLPRFVSFNEMEAMLRKPLEHIDKTIGNRDNSILMTLYCTGIRAGEMRNINMEDIDFERNIIKLKKCKNGHDREVPLTEKGIYSLKKYLGVRNKLLRRGNNSKALYLSNNGNRITISSILAVVKRYAKSCNIQRNITTHDIRHTFATHMLEHSNQNIEIISKWLGHLNLTSTLIYTFVTDRKMKEAAVLHPIDKLMGGC